MELPSESYVLGPPYDEDDVDALRMEVIPKYISFFNTLTLDRLMPSPHASVMVCGATITRLVEAIAHMIPHCPVVAFEPSEASILAAKTSMPPRSKTQWRVLKGLPIQHPDKSFTHVVIVHPIASAPLRLQLLREAARLLVPAGQLLVALPLRGSFPEIADMMREFSLKHDNPEFGQAIELASQSRPTPETLTEDLERLGYDDISVDVELLSVPFESGRDFSNHSVFRLMVGPDLGSMISGQGETVAFALDYARGAIGKYWSEGPFDLTVNLGIASARKP